MRGLLLSFIWWFAAFIRSRHDLWLEFVALRQQLGVLSARSHTRGLDRLFWVSFLGLWSRWAECTKPAFYAVGRALKAQILQFQMDQFWGQVIQSPGRDQSKFKEFCYGPDEYQDTCKTRRRL